MDEENNSSFGGIIGLIIFIVIIYFAFKWIGGVGKYEGTSAEEWADEAAYWEDKYTEFRSCVEDFDNMDIKDQIDYGGVFYYCE